MLWIQIFIYLISWPSYPTFSSEELNSIITPPCTSHSCCMSPIFCFISASTYEKKKQQKNRINCFTSVMTLRKSVEKIRIQSLQDFLYIYIFYILILTSQLFLFLSFLQACKESFFEAEYIFSLLSKSCWIENEALKERLLSVHFI